MNLVCYILVVQHCIVEQQALRDLLLLSISEVKLVIGFGKHGNEILFRAGTLFLDPLLLRGNVAVLNQKSGIL